MKTDRLKTVTAFGLAFSAVMAAICLLFSSGVFGETVPSSGSETPASMESVLPAESLVIWRTIPLRALGEESKTLLAHLKLTDVVPLDLIKWTSYGKAVGTFDDRRGAAAAILADRRAGNLFAALFLPVTDIRTLAEALGGTEESEKVAGATVWKLEKPIPRLMVEKSGWAVFVPERSRGAIQAILRSQPSRNRPFAETNEHGALGPVFISPAALADPALSLEVTPRGIDYFGRKGVQTLDELPTILAELFPVSKKWSFHGLAKPETRERLTDLLRLARENLSAVRLDLGVEAGSLIGGIALSPQTGSELAERVRDPGGPQIPTSLDGSLLKVAPDFGSPLAGQLDIDPAAAARFDPPFNRLRHVEYSFNLPHEGELFAESWAFFLEVDDANKFMRELTIPKAQMVGREIGSEKVGEIGAKILGNWATRRQARGFRPILGAPEEAAALGEQLGAKIGGEIGSTLGEQKAMKTYDFEGAPLLVADVALYQKTLREKEARQRGESTRPPIFLTGEPTLRVLIGRVLSGLQSGSLEGIVSDQFAQLSGSSANDFGLMRRNLTLLLGPNHLLMVPGNEDVLRAGKKNWDRLLAHEPPLQPTPSAEKAWAPFWDDICRAMTRPSDHILRGANRVDSDKVCQAIEEIRRYFPGLPHFPIESLPENGPVFFSVSTTTSEAAFFYGALPNRWLRLAADKGLAKLPELIKKKAASPPNPSDAKSGENSDTDWGDFWDDEKNSKSEKEEKK